MTGLERIRQVRGEVREVEPFRRSQPQTLSPAEERPTRYAEL